MGITVTGDAEIIRNLRKMRKTSARRVMTAGAAEAAKKLAKLVKAEVPARYKSVRKSIGWRRMKVKDAPGGGAKAGARVGRASKNNGAGRAEGRPGVGIGAANIHWWFYGTKGRITGDKGGPERYTGAMDPQSPSPDKVAARKAGTLKLQFTLGARKQFKKEVAKGKAF